MKQRLAFHNDSGFKFFCKPPRAPSYRPGLESLLGAFLEGATLYNCQGEEVGALNEVVVPTSLVHRCSQSN